MRKAQRGSRFRGRRLVFGISGFLLFVFSIGLMKEGALGFEQLIGGHLKITNVADSMGFGWLMAYAILSGSPVAAASLALLNSGALQSLQAFTMIAGSRLGASFIVLLIGFVYALQGHERWGALTAGVLSLLLTSSIQLLELPMGLIILRGGWLEGLSIPALDGVAAVLNRGLEPLVLPLSALLPSYALFLVGVGVIAMSFKLFDRALPEFQLQQTDLVETPHLIYRPEVMFLMGLVITVVTMSVSISVGILVPLSARGYLRRENIIPYIMGANVSTFVDTLFAAILLGDAQGVTVVAVHMVCAALISLLIVVLAYRPYERLISKTLAWVTRGHRNFAIFLGVIFVVPLVLISL